MYELEAGRTTGLCRREDGPFATDWDSLAQTRELTDSLTGLQKGNVGTYNGKELDGSYELTVTAFDHCGNSSKSVCTLNYDNTAPEYTVTMTGGNTDSQGPIIIVRIIAVWRSK